MKRAESSTGLSDPEGRVSHWLIASLLAVFAATTILCLIGGFEEGEAPPPVSEPVPVTRSDGAASPGAVSVASVTPPPQFPRLGPGDAPLRSVRRRAPDTDGESLARSLPGGEGSAAAYSLGALPEEIRRAVEDPSVLLIARTGARITPALTEKNYFVSHVPADDLAIPTLQSDGRRDRTGIDVVPFSQLPSRKLAGISDVEHAGEILALAIARQLGQMDFRVRLELNDSMARRIRPLDADSTITRGGRLAAALRGAWAKLDIRWELSGSVRFWIVRRTQKGGGTVTAYLAVLPVITVAEPAPGKPGQTAARTLYRPPPVFDQEVMPGNGSGDASALGRIAARRVLDRVVTRLLGAPELERTLVAHIHERDERDTSERSATDG